MSVVDLLRQVSLFADLRESELVALASCLGRRVFAKNMILFHKGSPAQSLYLIGSGAARVFALGEIGQEITLERIGMTSAYRQACAGPLGICVVWAACNGRRFFSADPVTRWEVLP